MAKVIASKDGLYLFDVTSDGLSYDEAVRIAALETEENTCEWPEEYEAWPVR